MTIDERVNDVMAKLHSWVEQGAHKRFHWDKKRRQHIVESDEETRRAIIEIIVKAGRQDGIEAEREAFIEIATERRESIFNVRKDCDQYTHNYEIWTMQICELDHIISMIRARSEGEQQQKGD